MFDRILLPLDGSPFAEEIIPYGLGLARSTGAKLTLLRVAEHEGDVVPAGEYVRSLTQRLNAEGKVLAAHIDPAIAILGELEQHPHTLAAMTTHGHSELLEAILGSVALRIVQHARQPVLLYRPRGSVGVVGGDQVATITTVIAPLDGSHFSESMLPHAAEMAKALRASLTLVQVISPEIDEPPEELAGDVLESSYIHGRAEEARRRYGVETEWEVLHGHPADAICEYVHSRHDLMLAMSSHTRAGLREIIFGSVTHECVRCSGVPVLVYRPQE